MSKSLRLQFSESVQGKFELKALNLMLVFQVNCPGCFIYGLPILEKLYRENNCDVLSFSALSTAFEDFQLNNLENTRLLLRDNILVGETKKALLDPGQEKCPFPIDFPVLMDKLIPSSEYLTEQNLEKICSLYPTYAAGDDGKQTELKMEITNYFRQFELISYTFTINQFAGTPTWVLFDSEFIILEQWFGHKSFDETEGLIKSKIHHLT